MGEETKPAETSTIPPRHYTLGNLAKLIGGMFPSSTDILAHCDCKKCISICICSCRSIVSSVSAPIKIFVCLKKNVSQFDYHTF